MATATVTAKGQITIPKAVREELGVQTGDQVVFVKENEGVSLHAVPRTALSALRGIARSKRQYTGRAAERAAAQALAAENARGRHGQKRTRSGT